MASVHKRVGMLFDGPIQLDDIYRSSGRRKTRSGIAEEKETARILSLVENIIVILFTLLIYPFRPHRRLNMI